MSAVGYQWADKRENPVVKLYPPHLDDELAPVRRDVAVGCCCCLETPSVRTGRVRRVWKEMGTERRHDGTMGTG